MTIAVRRRDAALVGLFLLVSFGCEASRVEPEVRDGGVDAPAALCTRDEDCDDGSFCNGAERCDPSRADASARGCVTGSPPCADAPCLETEGRCGGDCEDADGDGHEAEACGGDDCDDADPTRFPGAAEVCDAEHDEDCDPATLGGADDSDRDGDGHVSSSCCNGASCGDDCDDASGGVFPGVPDDCNAIDDDCDGTIDERPTLRFYRDLDGDEFGVTEDSVLACSAPPGYAVLRGDCDDTRRGVNPSAMEICNGRDDDCDGATDPGCACDVDDTMPCGVTDVGRCAYGTMTCLSMGGSGSAWGPCVGAIGPGMEACGGEDEDCDGRMDESDAIDARTFYLDMDGDGAGRMTVRVVACTAPMGYSTRGDDCNDTDSNAFPGATEVCNLRDDDCDTRTDEGLTLEVNCLDRDGDGYHAGESCGMRCVGLSGYARMGGDCSDSAPRAYPGQREFFGMPYCTPGAATAIQDSRTGEWACPISTIPPPPTPSWDFDCDGREEPQPSVTSTSCGALCGATCESGPRYTRLPACGQNVAWLGCMCTGTMCAALAGGRDMAPMPCR